MVVCGRLGVRLAFCRFEDGEVRLVLLRLGEKY